MTDPTSRIPLPGGAPAAPPPPPPPAPPATGAPPPPPSPPQAWRPPRSNDGRSASIVIGLILVVAGLWFFAETTLGLELPRIRWGELWPLLLIGLGLWIVAGSLRRSR